MLITSEEILKLLLAVAIGGIIGLERESRQKSAGFRTITLLCLGATIFTIASLKLGVAPIAANIATGIGFLGAGVIIREEGRVRGLTTASTIWVAAALGMAIGLGAYLLALSGTLVAIIVLQMFGRFDPWLDRRIKVPRTYELALVDREDKPDQIISLFQQSGVQITKQQQRKRNGHTLLELETIGRMAKHDQVIAQLVRDGDVIELQY